MKKIYSFTFAIVLLTSLLAPNYVMAAAQLGSTDSYQNFIVPATARYSDWLKGTTSTLDIEISDVPSNDILSDGIYAGWCIQPSITGLLHGESATIYSSLNQSNLPDDLIGLPWGKINYLLNHKIHKDGKTDIEFIKDVQTALWMLLGDENPEFGISPEAQQMFEAANNNADYEPVNGDYVAFIIYSDGMSTKEGDSVQEAIIEVQMILPPTPTPTDTITPPPACQPTVVQADFSGIVAGESVEGMGVVAPGLNIDAKGTAIKIQEGVQPAVYGADVGNIVWNGGIGSGGFSDRVTQQASQPHLYTFTFEPGTSVSNFTLRMLDFGDLNPASVTSSYTSMTAYNANGIVVAKQELKYTITGYYMSPLYGNLIITGDALRAVPGEPGNWTWDVSGSGIVRVVLEFGTGFDPNIGFDTLAFTTECSSSPTETSTVAPTLTSPPSPTTTLTPTPPPACQPTVVQADFSGIVAGESVEGMGVVAPGLNIDAKGTAIKIQEGVQPAVYGADVGNIVWNGGIGSGGFSDRVTQQASQPHLYTFTFEPGTSVSNFTLRMLDFGDLNPASATSSYASMTAYNANGIVVAKQELKYTITGYYMSPLYGNLIITGDALRAVPGEPGNWTWDVSGSGIVRVILEFGTGFDPNIGFDILAFTTECSSCSIMQADFSGIVAGESVEGMGVVAPGLNIDAKGTAIKIQEGVQPAVYGADVANIVWNGGIGSGGFSDRVTQQASQPHLYTFTFEPGTSVSNFTLRMLDFGDLNPASATSSYASMTAYNANGIVVAKQELKYTITGYYMSPLYGNLIITGDALRAVPGEPGNWTWDVSGSGIVRVVLEFGTGFDPNIGFDNLSYLSGCQ